MSALVAVRSIPHVAPTRPPRARGGDLAPVIVSASREPTRGASARRVRIHPHACRLESGAGVQRHRRGGPLARRVHGRQCRTGRTRRTSACVAPTNRSRSVLMDGVEVNVSGGPFRFQGHHVRQCRSHRAGARPAERAARLQRDGRSRYSSSPRRVSPGRHAGAWKPAEALATEHGTQGGANATVGGGSGGLSVFRRRRRLLRRRHLRCRA